MQEIKIFISSPGDVQAERGMVDQVIERLQGDYWNFVRLEPVLWEYEATRAVAHFNEEIIAPAECDIVLAFLWTRLGSRMPPQFTRAGRHPLRERHGMGNRHRHRSARTHRTAPT